MPLREAFIRIFHHATMAFAVFTITLVIAEWLVPGFFLPYLPLWPLPTVLILMMIGETLF